MKTVKLGSGIHANQIVFDYDRNGRKVAYYLAFSARSGRRRIRMPVAEAELIVATLKGIKIEA